MNYGPLVKEIVVQGSFRNTKVFQEEFKCPNKTFMNPPRKCPFLGRKTISDDMSFMEMEDETGGNAAGDRGVEGGLESAQGEDSLPPADGINLEGMEDD